MKLHNIRMGFATNSSSTHSIVFLNGVREEWDGGHQFGWEDFTLRTREAKLTYLAQMLYYSITREYSSDGEKHMDEVLGGTYKDLGWEEYERRKGEYARPLIEQLMGETGFFDESGYVDHQSVFGFPSAFHGGLHKDFVKDFKTFLCRDDVTILGGNDNSNGHPLHSSSIEVGDFDSMAAYVARKDGDYYTLFDRYSGAKIRLSLYQNAAPYDKSSTPELVDISITDYCPFNCEYCYQASTRDGQHAPLDYLKSLADQLSAAEVFEVALGGGEPTLHPDFLEILRYFRNKNVVPNFTTKNIDWLKDASYASEVLDLCGAFAYSAESGKTAEAVNKLFSKAIERIPGGVWSNRKKLVFQHTMGTCTKGEFAQLIKFCAEQDIRLTLLGYKTVGRGADFIPVNYDWITEVFDDFLRDHPSLSVGVDTTLARQLQPYFEKKGIPSILYTLNEGAFSMYIHAPSKTMAPSSFCDKALYEPFDPSKWLETFQSYKLEVEEVTAPAYQQQAQKKEDGYWQYKEALQRLTFQSVRNPLIPKPLASNNEDVGI